MLSVTKDELELLIFLPACHHPRTGIAGMCHYPDFKLTVTVTSLAKHAHWRNSGMNILGGTNHLLVGCMVHSTRQTSRTALLTGPGTCGWGGRGPRREHAVIIVLNGHCVQLFPKHFPLSPQDRVTTFISRAFCCSGCRPTQPRSW